MDEKPTLTKHNGNIIFDVVVRTSPGFGTARGMMRFVDECHKYSREIHVKNLHDGREGDCKRIMETLMCSSARGEMLEFIVEGDDSEAEKFALRIYSALTSEDSYNMDFYRFEKDNQ